MTKSENIYKTEFHGCIVCAKIYNILAVYTPNGNLLDCAITSPGGHRVHDERHPLVACDTHPVEKVEAAYKRWQTKLGKGSMDED